MSPSLAAWADRKRQPPLCDYELVQGVATCRGSSRADAADPGTGVVGAQTLTVSADSRHGADASGGAVGLSRETACHPDASRRNANRRCTRCDGCDLDGGMSP